MQQPQRSVEFEDSTQMLHESQAVHAPAPNSTKDNNATRNTQLQPVTSAGPSSGSGARGHVPMATPKPTLSAALMLPFLPAPTLTSERTSTDSEMDHDINLDLLSLMEPYGSDIAHCFQHASQLPPVTPESLAELDMFCVFNNPKLRLDINFDRELHFRPNLDGSKGREKVHAAEDYWKALEGEFVLYDVIHARKSRPQEHENDAYWTQMLSASQRRLPTLFDAIRQIVKTLGPDCDKKAVDERLDVAFLMREIRNGVCDLVDLSVWLAKVLKTHCAPMRDKSIDRMQKQISHGATTQQPATLVKGIRQLLNILESMSLDVANHRIRHSRPFLVNDTVNFLRRYNAARIARDKIDVRRSRQWLDYEMMHQVIEEVNPSPLDGMTAALLRDVIFSDNGLQYPQTFYLDADRLQTLRTNLHTIVYQHVCHDIFREFANLKIGTAELHNAVTGLHMSIAAIVGTSGRFVERLENIAAEIMRIALLTHQRTSSFDSELLTLIELRLQSDLHPTSVPFDQHAQDVADRLLPKVQASVKEHVKLSALNLQDRLVTPGPLPSQSFGHGAVFGPAAITPNTDPDEEIVRRFTHIIVLHWQIWAELVYQRAPDDDSDMPSSGGTSSGDAPSRSSPSPSLTFPVASPVFAPGRKWLPIGITITEVPGGLPTPLPSPGIAVDSSASGSDSDSDSDHVEAPTSNEEHATLEPKHQQPA